MIPEELVKSLKEFCKEEVFANVNFKNFEEREPNEHIFAVDSGVNEVLSLGSASLFYVKVGYVGFFKEKRVKTEVRDMFLLLSPKGVKSFGGFIEDDELEFFTLRMRELLQEKKMDYDSIEKTILSGILRLLEMKIGMELDGIILFDFPFDFRFEILKELFSKIRNEKVVGIVKRSRLLSNSFGIKNVFIVDLLYKMKPKGRWYVKIREDLISADYVVKFLESERAYPFRVSVKKNCYVEEIFGILSYYADPSRRGYPFPLTRVDRIVRVEEREIARIRKRIYSLIPEIERFVVPEVKF